MTHAAARDDMSDALDIVIENATSARELCEVGEDYQKAKIKLHLLQALTAMQSALDVLRSSKSDEA